jgi:hypothetical protein
MGKTSTDRKNGGMGAFSEAPQPPNPEKKEEEHNRQLLPAKAGSL